MIRKRTDTRYGFLDESGGVDPFSGSHVIVVALLTTHAPRKIDLRVKRTHQKLGRRVRGEEIKASSSQERVITRFLESMADEEIEIVAVVVDKRAILRPPENTEDIYREAVAKAVSHCVARWPRIDLSLDKRYTKKALREELELTIREGIAHLPQEVVMIRQEDSRNVRGLQAVDFIAWAIYQKYETNDSRFYAIIQDKIVVEEIIQRSLW